MYPGLTALRTGQSQSGVIMGIHKQDGSLTWVSIESHPILREGKIHGVVTIITDITQRKADEHALRTSEERWKLAVEGSRDGIWDNDLEKGEVFLSRRWKEMLGFHEDEAAHSFADWQDRIHPEDRQTVLAAVRNHWDGNSPFYQTEYRIRCKDGSWKWVLARGRVVSRAADGKPLRFVGALTDISERKLSEERLRESEERLAKVFQCSPAAVVLAEREGGYLLEVNDAFERITGYRRDEVVGVPDMESRLFVDARDLEQCTRLLTESGRFADREFRLRRKDGAIRTCVISAELIHVQGRVFSISATMDITERRLAEDSLRRSEAKYRAIVENSLDGIIFADANGVILERSPAHRLITGFGDEERLGHVGFETIYPDDLPLVRKAWMEVLNQPERLHRLDFRVKHKDGSWRWVEVSAQNLLANQSVQAVVLNTRNITERRQTQQALEQAQSNLTALVESTDDLIWSVDVKHRLLTFNRALADHIRRTYGIELQPGEVPDLLYTIGMLQWRNLYQRALDEGPFRIEIEITGGRTVEFSLNPVLSGGEGVGVSVFGKDITERKQAEAQRQKLWEQLAQAQKMESIGRLAGGVAHDFNNLLTVINGYSQLALSRLKGSDPLRHQLAEIRKAGERAASLTRQLLAFSRKQVMQPRALNLNRVVEEMQSMLRRLVGEDVEVSFVLSPDNPILHTDPHQLEQVIMNLAVNARDAMPAGGKLRVETALMDQDAAAVNPEMRPGRYAMLSVSDTGVGMDQATLQRIYEPFFTTKEAGHGTGLGLSMVQGIVAQSGGYIQVSSELGHGSTFRICLPALSGKAHGEDHQAGAPEFHGTETILVVEDQPEVCDYAAAVLQEYGYRVIQAVNAAEALLACEREPGRIHLLLTDVVMPNTSGRELAAQLTARRPEMKTLFMSGYTDDVIAQHGVLDEGTHFLQKPFSPDGLAVKIRAVLGPTVAAARILVVDDEPGVRSYLRAVLVKGGYEVSEAGDGKEALRLALAEPPELVITDLVMPEQEGIETIQALRLRLPEVAIIAISGAFGGQFLSMAKTLGADLVLDKPVSAEVLLANVAEVLTRRSPRSS
jgi:PAS domain S-box-containing protein